MNQSSEYGQQQPLKEEEEEEDQERKGEYDGFDYNHPTALAHHSPPSSSSSPPSSSSSSSSYSLATPPALDNNQPPKPITQPIITINRLPYACRDFKNGHCARGEHCRFIHTLDSRFVIMIIWHSLFEVLANV